MKKLTRIVGICLFSAGLGILLAMFLPHGLLISIEAFLLILAGIFILC